MGTNKKRGAFTDPAIRQKALESRLSSPHGRRQAKYKNIPGLWGDHEEDTLGRRLSPKEKAAISTHFIERFQEVDDVAIEAVMAVLTAIVAKQGKELSMPEAQVLGKILDKKMPDLRTDGKSPTGRVTRFVIGAPLQRMVANGATIAGEIREEPAEEEPHENGA